MNNKKNKGRRHSINPANFRYTVNFNALENAKFISLFESSKMKKKADFLRHCILNKPIKYQRVDKSAMEVCQRLIEFNSQIRIIGVNYNQIVKIMNTNFSEKKASYYLNELHKKTSEIFILYKKIIPIIEKYKQQWLEK